MKLLLFIALGMAFFTELHLDELLDWIRGWLWFLYDRAAAMADEDVKEVSCDAGEENVDSSKGW